jgi:(p)ppGpp synthase/HD superfamily hydrolase
MGLSPTFDAALTYAAVLHRDQTRKGTDIPYVAHLLSVSSRVITAGGPEVQAIAGLLHDAAEDQGGEATLHDIRARFGGGVAQIVYDCTDAWVEPKSPWRPRKEAYLGALPHKQKESLLVSLADKVDNADAILKDHRAVGEPLWDRFTGKRDGTIWYYRSLSDIFSEALPCALSDELRRIVSQLPDPVG